MKNVFYLIFLTLTLLVLNSCEKETLMNDEPTTGDEIMFSEGGTFGASENLNFDGAGLRMLLPCDGYDVSSLPDPDNQDYLYAYTKYAGMEHVFCLDHCISKHLTETLLEGQTLCNVTLRVQNPYTGEWHKWKDVFNDPSGIFVVARHIQALWATPEHPFNSGVIDCNISLIQAGTGNVYTIHSPAHLRFTGLTTPYIIYEDLTPAYIMEKSL